MPVESEQDAAGIHIQEIIIKKYFLFRKMNTLYQKIIINVCFL